MLNQYKKVLLKDAVVLGVLWAISVVIAITMGHDANWDLRNYHLYNAFALLDWRYSDDIMPVGIQTMFNPLMDLPYFIVLKVWGLQAATIIQSFNYALLVFAALKLNLLVFQTLPSIHATNRAAFVFPLAATVLGATGVAAFSQIATTFNETQLGFLVIAGLAAVVAALDRRRGDPRLFVIGGAFLGVAGGLKLTSALYTLACVLALLTTLGPQKGLWPAIRVSLGAGAGFFAAFGWWAAIVYRTYQNPIFPLYNDFFRSAWYPPINEIDIRFFPKSPAEWVAYPFNWMWRLSGEVSEPLLRDPRLALFLIAVLLVGLVRLPVGTSSERFRFVVAFGLIAYVLWLAIFAISRYAVSIEIVAATVIVGLLARVRCGSVLAIVVVAVVQLATVYPAWERLPFSLRSYEFQFPPIPDNSIVLVGNPPVGFLLPFMRAKNIRFLSANHTAIQSRGYGVFEQIKAQVVEHSGPILLLARIGADPNFLRSLGVAEVEGGCKIILNNIEPAARDIFLCELQKI